MKIIIKLSLVVIISGALLLGGCSKKAGIKKDAAANKTKKSEVTKTTAKNNQNMSGRGATPVVASSIKTDNLKAEKLKSDSMKNLTSIKSDTQSERDALAAKGRMTELQKVYFDYDRSDIRSDAKETLVENSNIIKDKKVDVVIEGYCDERGTEEYNLALGLKRAESVKKYLSSLGIDDISMTTISYGEARPEVADSNESAWSKNRRAVLKEIKE